MIVAVAAIAAFLVLRGRGERGGSAARPNPGGGGDPWAAAPGSGSGPTLAPRDLAATLGLRDRRGGPPVTITGVVRLAPTGTPVADAEVAFMSDTGENTATTDGTGRYSIRVASGIRWKVHARTDTAVGYPESIEPAADTVRDLTIHPTATIRGRVVDTRGGVVGGATVSVEVDAADRGLLEAAVALSVVADGAGRFELTSVPGDLKVRAYLGLVQGVTMVRGLAPGDTTEITITALDPITIRGKVVDGAGQPVAAAKILVAATVAPGGPIDRYQYESGADGGFVARAPACWVRVEARKDGDLSPAIAQQYASGETRELTLTLTPPAMMRGKVITADGTPVVGAKVRLSANAVYDTLTFSDGSFEIGAPAGQPYTVKVRHSDGYTQRYVAAWSGDETFVLRRFGTITIEVPGHSGEVTAQIDSFVPAGDSAPRPPPEARFRGLGGRVVLSSLEPGVYDLTVATAGAGATRVPHLTVADGEVRTLTVELAAPVAVRGVVRSSNQPIAAAQVTIGGRVTFTDAKGRFVVPDVAAGPVTITVVKTGFTTAWWSTVAGASDRPVEIELRSDGDGLVEGVGVVVTAAGQGATVVAAVVAGSPAAGKLMVGDVITEVDGTDVTQAALDDVVARLRGSAGSSVSITVRRGADTVEVDVVRKRLVVPPAYGTVAATAVTRGGRC